MLNSSVNACARSLVLLLPAILLLVWACGDDDGLPSSSSSTTASLSATATASSPPTADPTVLNDEGLRLFLDEFAAAVEARSTEAIAATTEFDEFECGGGFVPEPTCQPSESVSAILVGLLQSEAYKLPESAYEDFWSEYLTNIMEGQVDEIGVAEARVYAYGVRVPLEEESAPAATIAITRIAGPRLESGLVPGPPNSRQLMLADLQADGDSWKIDELLLAPITEGLDAAIADLFFVTVPYQAD